jgi:hypothetical protein
MAEARIHYPTNGPEPLREVDLFPDGLPVDNIHNFEFDAGDGRGVRKRVRVKRGLINCEEVGIVANGLDMGAIMQAQYAKARVKSIEMEVSGGGEIIINTICTIAPGKLVKMRPGTKFRTQGTGKIIGGIIEAGSKHEILTGTCNWEPEGVSSGAFSANWCGANNGVAENGAAISKAAEIVIKNSALPRVMVFPDTLYDCSTPIRLENYDPAVGYGYVSIILKGTDSSRLSTISTKIRFSNPDAFGIGVQLGKGVICRGLHIQGPFIRLFGSDLKAFTETKLADYSVGTGCRDSQFSPCTGFIIDYARGTVPPDGGFPGLDIYRGGDSVEGSTCIKLENCAVTNWVVGVGVSINGRTLNADSCVFTHCTIEANKVDFAFGQDQTKNCVVDNIQITADTHTVFDNRSYGSGTGAPPKIHHLTIAGKVNQVFNIDTSGRFGFYAHGIYGETLFRLGTILGKPTIIEDLQFNAALINEFSGIIGAPDLYAHMNNVTFLGGHMRHYDNLNTKRIHMAATNCNFIGVNFDTPPLFQAGGENQFMNCQCDNGAVMSSGDLSVTNYYDVAQYLQHGRMRIKFTQNFTYCDSITEYNFTRDYETRVLATNGANLVVNATTRTATFPTGDEINYARVNDYIFKETPGDFYDYPGSPMPYQTVGRIVSMTGGVTTLSDVPVGVVSGTYNLYMSFYRQIGIPFIGDLTASSDIVSNVESSNYSFPYIGMRISAYPFGVMGNVYVKDANFAAKTVQLSSITFSSVKNYEFNNYGEQTIRGALNPAHPNYANAPAVIFTGAKFQGYFVDDDSAVYPQEFKCIKPGYNNKTALGGLRQAVWEYEHTDIFAPATNSSGVLNVTRILEGGAKVLSIQFIPSADMTISADTVPAGTGIIDNLFLAAGQPVSYTVPGTLAAAISTIKTIYFTGTTASGTAATIEIKIYKKSI